MISGCCLHCTHSTNSAGGTWLAHGHSSTAVSIYRSDKTRGVLQGMDCLQTRPHKVVGQCSFGKHLYRAVVNAMMLSLPCS